jgi:cell division transport system ATP-binding protein
VAAAPVIALHQVSKRYPGGEEVLCGIDFAVAAGEMVFVTGHSGAGKSTLLKLLAAIERASSGTVLVGGRNVATLGARGIPFLRRKLGLVFQDQKLLYDRSVFDNVMLPLVVTGEADRDAARRARAALDKVGLLEREKAYPVALSGGEQQRLCVARAVVNRPAMVLADEPTSNLDADSARAVLDIFRSFHQVGVTIVIATHDASAPASMPARLVRLTRGRLS